MVVQESGMERPSPAHHNTIALLHRKALVTEKGPKPLVQKWIPMQGGKGAPTGVSVWVGWDLHHPKDFWQRKCDFALQGKKTHNDNMIIQPERINVHQKCIK